MRLFFCALVSLCLAVPAAAKTPLRDVSEIDDALMVIAIANEIRETCEGIDARMIRALGQIRALRSQARGLGYSADEIEAYVTSKSEKRRMRAKASRYLASKGVDSTDAQSLCAFGRAEITRGSAIGALLR